MQWTVRRGTTSHTVRLFAQRRDGSALAGWSPESGLTAAYLRETDTEPTPIELAAQPETGHRAGRWAAFEAIPGLYELDLPDEALAEGRETVIVLQSPGEEALTLRLDLVGYDPADGERLGLEALSREGRHAVITRAFREVVPAIIREFQEEAAEAEEKGREP